MKRILLLASALLALLSPVLAVAEEAPKSPSNKSADAGDEVFKAEEVVTSGSVGATEYQATTGRGL